MEPTESTNTTSMIDASPMERWERESVRDQVWNGLLGVYVEDDQDMELDDGWSDCVEAAGSDGTEQGTCTEVRCLSTNLEGRTLLLRCPKNAGYDKASLQLVISLWGVSDAA
jgi:hypothetical protein